MKSIIIGIAGGTGSGKSTFTNRLKKRFGDHVTVIYHDNYYRRHDDISFEVYIQKVYENDEEDDDDKIYEVVTIEIAD